jgi:hypothetical protein
MAEAGGVYPASLKIDYPEKCDRLATLLRIVVVIPILVLFGLLTGSVHQLEGVHRGRFLFGGGGYVYLATLLMILFRKKYPRWWFDWNLSLTGFAARVLAYFAVLTHRYPSTDEEQAVHIEIPYPDVAKDLSRGMPLIKWLLVIPHMIVLAVLVFVAVISTILAWFSIVFTGRYPRGVFDFVVGVMRWGLRVNAYAFLLTTDKYPPFGF